MADFRLCLNGRSKIGRAISCEKLPAQSLRGRGAEIQAEGEICFCPLQWSGTFQGLEVTFGRCHRNLCHKPTFPNLFHRQMWPSPVESMPADNHSLAIDNPAADSPGPIGGISWACVTTRKHAIRQRRLQRLSIAEVSCDTHTCAPTPPVLDGVFPYLFAAFFSPFYHQGIVCRRAQRCADCC